MGIKVICLLTEKMIKFKANNGNFNFPTQFFLGNITNKFSYVEAEEMQFKRMFYGFLIEYDAIDKSDKLNIQI